MKRDFTIKEKLGSVLLDLPRFCRHAACPHWLGSDWVRYGNRNDRFLENPSGRGVQCDWEYTRKLHLCEVFPRAGNRLMQRALHEWPIRLQDSPVHADPGGTCGNDTVPESGVPEVSFAIGHRGLERLPHLLATLRSIAVQANVRFECIVVEQDNEPRLQGRLPSWVRYVYTAVDPGTPYGRSSAFNVAASFARSPLIIFHDNDLLVPVSYAMEALRLFREGYEVINLKRFIFYLARMTDDAAPRLDKCSEIKVDHVMENATGGGSIAVSSQAFDAIGGFDEDFLGWGGEDNEFWERCLTRKVWNFACLPLIHLWHEAQQGRRAERGMGSLTADLYLKRKAVSPAARISELKTRRGGHSVTMKNHDLAAIRPDAYVRGLVSVIIPVFNRGRLLEQTVLSVLRQTYENFEIIIVDDGSTDDTPRVVDHLCREHSTKIRGIRKDNAGPGPAREAGRQIARGEFIQYLDSDDMLDCRKFESQVALLNARPDVDVAYGITRLVDSKGDVLKPVYRWTGEGRDSLYPGLLVDRWWSSHTPLWRKTLSDKIGPWSSLRYSEDWEYEARAGGLGAKLGSVGQVVCDVRAHGGARETRSGRWLSPADQVTFFQVLYENATRAGVAAHGPEMRHFSRWVFFEARKAGVAGDPGSAVRLMSIAKSARTGFCGDLMLYRWITFVFGWRLPVRFTDGFNRLRGRKFGRDTRPQSWMNGHE